MTVRYYLGRLTEERILHTVHNTNNVPSKGDFVFLDEDDVTPYKVMYRFYYQEEDTYEVFVRHTIDEDF